MVSRRLQPPPIFHSPPPPLMNNGPTHAFSNPASGGFLDKLANILGLSAFASLLSGPDASIFNAAWLFLLGSIFETGRQVCRWAMDRFKVRYYVTAEFYEGDPSYEWIINFLSNNDVWRRSKDFSVSSKSSQLRGGVSLSAEGGSAEYVPKYNQPHLFRWRGFWIEVQRNSPSSQLQASPFGGPQMMNRSSVTLSLYSLKLDVLSDLVDEAHQLYLEGRRPHVVVHLNDQGGALWSNVKRKNRRPLASIVLPEGILESLAEDIKDFMCTEDWYRQAGIPYRRGYLLYGPPGTGKTSTIYALAGEFGLEIYALSLSSGTLDDASLERCVSALPKNSILLLEDIDCAFPSREEEDELPFNAHAFGANRRRNIMQVTMSGLLNVLDGVGSEDGKIVFATTNYVDRLDAALMRPGRVDKKIEYKLATKSQARALFNRFYPPKYATSDEKDQIHQDRSEAFAEQLPEDEFTTAELQGYLLSHKKDPEGAVKDLQEWIECERAERKRRKEVERKEREKAKERAQRYRESAYGHPSAFGAPML